MSQVMTLPFYTAISPRSNAAGYGCSAEMFAGLDWRRAGAESGSGSLYGAAL